MLLTYSASAPYLQPSKRQHGRGQHHSSGSRACEIDFPPALSYSVRWQLDSHRRVALRGLKACERGQICVLLEHLSKFKYKHLQKLFGTHRFSWILCLIFCVGSQTGRKWRWILTDCRWGGHPLDPPSFIHIAYLISVRKLNKRYEGSPLLGVHKSAS